MELLKIKLPDMKAYKIDKDGVIDIVAAEGIIEALLFYCETTGQNFSEYFKDGDVIEEIPEGEWSGINITNNNYDSDDPEDKEVLTLAEMMVGLTQADFISSSEY